MASFGSSHVQSALSTWCFIALMMSGLAAVAQPPQPESENDTSTPAEPPAAPPVPVVAVSLDQAIRPPDKLLYFRLDDGSGFTLDRLRREPISARATRIEDNLFERIGRRPDQPAHPGELLLLPLSQRGGEVEDLLLVETSTGYVAYFEKLGKAAPLGSMRTTIGRPFEGLASGDGRFILLGRKGGGGRTEDAWLYHTPSGRARRLKSASDMPLEPETAAVTGLPKLAGEVTAVGIDDANGRTRTFMLIDSAAGTLDNVLVEEDGSLRGVRRLGIDLFSIFPRTQTAPASPRFLAVPVDDDKGATRHLMLVDVGTGVLGWLRNADRDAGTPALSRLGVEISRFFPRTGTSRTRSLAAVPRYFGDGDTLGAWLIDGHARRVLYLDGFGNPGSIRATPVELAR